ncbi:hypothetical protein [Nocardiopsis sp. MG754419]|uniref:hypothetical protein n=1 Tax=Nocardiopsis sp. MG754419 TaxID=2259865 RepID=UPI001BABDE7C|nr:hypothetical protein [Nocardiopsis sp. MG754419]MBR8741614.1 hypothetical protein [Nocardiopsis sp. MG754419]
MTDPRPTGSRDEGWTRIDRCILTGSVAAALALIRERGAPMGVGEALDLFDERYEHLKATRPDDFAMDTDDRGRDVFL